MSTVDLSPTAHHRSAAAAAKTAEEQVAEVEAKLALMAEMAESIGGGGGGGGGGAGQQQLMLTNPFEGTAQSVKTALNNLLDLTTSLLCSLGSLLHNPARALIFAYGAVLQRMFYCIPTNVRGILDHVMDDLATMVEDEIVCMASFTYPLAVSKRVVMLLPITDPGSALHLIRKIYCTTSNDHTKAFLAKNALMEICHLMERSRYDYVKLYKIFVGLEEWFLEAYDTESLRALLPTIVQSGLLEKMADWVHNRQAEEVVEVSQLPDYAQEQFRKEQAEAAEAAAAASSDTASLVDSTSPDDDDDDQTNEEGKSLIDDHHSSGEKSNESTDLNLATTINTTAATTTTTTTSKMPDYLHRQMAKFIAYTILCAHRLGADDIVDPLFELADPFPLYQRLVGEHLYQMLESVSSIQTRVHQRESWFEFHPPTYPIRSAAVLD